MLVDIDDIFVNPAHVVFIADNRDEATGSVIYLSNGLKLSTRQDRKTIAALLDPVKH